MLNTDLLAKFAELDQRQKELNTERNRVLEEIAAIEAQVLEELVTSGVSSVKLANGLTVRAASQIWAKIHDKGKAVEILKACGYEDFVTETFNSNQLSAVLRELIHTGEGLPPEFEGVIEANEVFKPRTTKG